MDPKAVIITRLPLSLKEALDKYAYDNNMSSNAAMQLAIVSLLQLALPSKPINPRSAQRKAQRERAKQRQQLIKKVV